MFHLDWRKKLKELGYTIGEAPYRPFGDADGLTTDELEDPEGKPLDLPEKFFPKPHGYDPKKRKPKPN